MATEILEITYYSPPEEFNKVYQLEKGLVFKYKGDYTSLAIRLEQDSPLESFFFEHVTPGTPLYTLYGHSHVVVIGGCEELLFDPETAQGHLSVCNERGFTYQAEGIFADDGLFV